MKRLLSVLLVVCLAVTLAGCGPGWQGKFIRKKKGAKKPPKIYQIKRYPQKPSPELYKKHYAYTVTWMSELLSDLGQNHKKDVRCTEEIVSNMKDMQNILVPEWQEKFQRHLDNMMKVREIVVYEELSRFNIDYVKSSLDRENRAIKRDFSYKKVKDHLRKDLSQDAEEEQAASVEVPPANAQIQAAGAAETKPEEKVEPKDEPQAASAD